MTGNELVKAIKTAKGKINVQMLCPNDTVWVYAEKADLIRHFKNYKNQETGMTLVSDQENGQYALTIG